MLTDESIEIDLPEGAAASECDRAILKAACEAVMALRYERSPEFRQTVQRLRDEGWSVRWKLAWVVDLKREGDSEEATGATLDEALGQVAQLALADTASRWPRPRGGRRRVTT